MENKDAAQNCKLPRMQNAITYNKLNIPPQHKAAEKGEKNIIKRDILLPTGESAIVLRNFLTPLECQHFISQAEALGLEDTGYSHRIRKCDRVIAACDKVANWMFDRLKRWLEPTIDLTHSPLLHRKFGVPSSLQSYVWHPSGLNHVFRICRYHPNGFFAPHHDGGIAISEFQRSIKTFMVYLNDDFEGGTTSFFNTSQIHYEMPLEKNIVCQYHPRVGDALVFNHALTHDGGTVFEGQKYILRSEVMYYATKEEADRSIIEADHDVDVDFTWP